MFCPNCGKKCGDNDLFCGGCGTRLPARPVTASPAADAAPVAPAVRAAGDTPAASASHGAGIPSGCGAASAASARAAARAGSGAAAGSKEPAGPMAEGVIFTNLQALARKFGTDAAAVRKLLAAYAEASAAHGIRYRIVDAGDYVFRNPEAGRNRAVTLSPADSWVEHGYLLADYYRFGRSTADDETNYLFIVGGADVIPMPVLPQYITDPDYSDTDIDSDIPYAYLLGERTYPHAGDGRNFPVRTIFPYGTPAAGA